MIALQAAHDDYECAKAYYDAQDALEALQLAPAGASADSAAIPAQAPTTPAPPQEAQQSQGVQARAQGQAQAPMDVVAQGVPGGSAS